jgi:hypothetical protein
MRANDGFGLNMALSYGLVTNNATTNLHAVPNVTYSVNGIAYFKAAAVAQPTPTKDVITGVDFVVPYRHGAILVWCLDANGNVHIACSEIVPLGDDLNFSKPSQLPDIPNWLTAFGMTKLVNVLKGDGWNMGIDRWNVAPGTVVRSSVCVMPNEPLSGI